MNNNLNQFMLEFPIITILIIILVFIILSYLAFILLNKLGNVLDKESMGAK
jgi:hypothetical protein